MSNSLRPHEPQHTRPFCPSPTPGVYSNSGPLSQWCHPTISSSVIPCSSCPQSFPASGSFPMSQFFMSGGQSIRVSLQHQSFQRIFRNDVQAQAWRDKNEFKTGKSFGIRKSNENEIITLSLLILTPLVASSASLCHWVSFCFQLLPSLCDWLFWVLGSL